MCILIYKKEREPFIFSQNEKKYQVKKKKKKQENKKTRI